MTTSQAGSRSVLVVDDDRDIREVIEIALSSEGYDVRTASDGAEALAAVEAVHPDLILLDMRMPVMDGWAFADAYHRRLGPHAPIVVLTAAVDAGSYSAQIGAAGFLPKPFDLNQLIAGVGRHLSER